MPNIPNLVDMLSQIPLFFNLNEEDLRVLAGAVQAEPYPANSVVYRQGDPGAVLYILAVGRGILLRAEGNSFERKVGSLNDPGDHVGVWSLFVEDERDVTFLITKRSVLYSLTRSAFQNVIALHSSIQGNLNFEERPDLKNLHEEMQFSWMQPGESVLDCTHRHKWALQSKLLGIAALGGVVVLGEMLLWLIPQTISLGPPVLIITLLIAAAAAGFFYQDWRNDYFVVTNHRVVHEERVFAFLGQQTIRQAGLDNVQDVTVSQETFAARTFGFSDLIINTAGGTITFDTIPRAEDIQQIILKYRERYISRDAAERRAQIRREIEKRLGVDLQKEGAEQVDEIEMELEAESAKTAAPGATDKAQTKNQASPLRHLWQDIVNYLTPRIRFESAGTVTYRKHWVVLFREIAPPSMVLLLMLFLTLTRILNLWPPFLTMVTDLIPPVVLMLVLPFLLLVALFWWWWVFEDWRNDLYQITPTSVIDLKTQPLFFGEKREVQAPLENIQNVSAESNGLRRLLKWGEVIIETASEGQAALKWIDVYDPWAVSEDVIRHQRAFMSQEKEERELEQADLLSEWIAIYHQTVHPDAHAGEEGNVRGLQEKPEIEEEEEPEPPAEKGPPLPRPYEQL